MSRLPKINFQIIDFKMNEEIINWALNSLDEQLIDKTKLLFPNEFNVDASLKAKKEEINKSINRYQQVWDKYHNKFMSILSNVLNIEWPIDYKDINCYVGIIPTCPINIRDNIFFMPYWFNDEEVIDIIAHECCHLLFYLKWCQLHPEYNKLDFDYPSKLWKLSEMVIDPILNKKEFKEVFNHTFMSYEYFYDDKETMNKIIEIFNNNSIEDAINKSYDYLNEVQ